jgi:hypothetical protein
MLDVGGEHEGEGRGMKDEAEKRVEANVNRKMEGDARQEGYTGAWP